MAIYDRFGNPITLTAAIKVKDGHYAGFARYETDERENLVESMYCRADGGLLEVHQYFENKIAAMNKEDDARLWTALRDMESRIGTREAV